MRRVVHFVDSAEFGGVERMLLETLTGLDRRRWQPLLMHHPEPGLAPMVVEARAAGVEVRGVPRVTDRNAPLRFPGLLRRLRGEEPDVFHAHLNWPLACKWALLASALARTPATIASVHLFVDSLVNRSVRAQHRFFSTAVDRYVTVSRAVAARMREVFHVPAARIDVVHNGVDAGRFDVATDPALRRTLCADPGRPIVMTLARLSVQKGHDTLLDAASRVPGAVFVLVGDGPLRGSLERQARERNVADRVLFLGHRGDVAELLACCDLFVLPSLFEGLPLAVLEAMAAGKPVIASGIGGTDEALVHGESGLLVPPADPVALASAIRSLLTDPVRARLLANAGRERAVRRFSSRAMIDGVCRSYERVLEPGGSRRVAG